ncbi:hypothetical protein QA601_18640 [Chitinispirillales bacterium ANBcel5]|uniref:hypothetical protein n=1 Tax=Cellulosispirillum alkaliphilum TaxID=3039283 RepID=UPI002A506881|nr:hypothetical protein [Chitinispirillales bacterium ANBcel5]
MTNKPCKFMCFYIFIIAYVVLAANNKNSIYDDTLVDCTNEMLKKWVLESNIPFDSFKQFYGFYNINHCKIDSVSLREWLMEHYKDYNPFDTTNTIETKRMYEIAGDVFTTEDGWGDDAEEAMVKRMRLLLENDRMVWYYRKMWALVKYSENWFEHMIDLYYNLDTTNIGERSSIYRALIRRFEDSEDSVIHRNMESVLYAILAKGKEGQGPLMVIDSYISTRSEEYRYSIQRYYMFKERNEKLREIRKQGKLKAYFAYSDTVLSKLESRLLGNYSPPFDISKMERQKNRLE